MGTKILPEKSSFYSYLSFEIPLEESDKFMALSRNFYEGLLQNKTFLSDSALIRRPSCMPSSSFMFAILLVFVRSCSKDMWRIPIAMIVIMKNSHDV